MIGRLNEKLKAIKDGGQSLNEQDFMRFVRHDIRKSAEMYEQALGGKCDEDRLERLTIYVQSAFKRHREVKQKVADVICEIGDGYLDLLRADGLADRVLQSDGAGVSASDTAWLALVSERLHRQLLTTVLEQITSAMDIGLGLDKLAPPGAIGFIEGLCKSCTTLFGEDTDKLTEMLKRSKEEVEKNIQ